MGRPDRLDFITRDRRRLIAVRAVLGKGESAFPDIETLWSKPRLTVVNGAEAGQTLSLEDLIDRHRRLVLVDGGDGPRPVESVFASLLFITADPVADPASIDRFVSERIRASFAPLIDPLDPVGVCTVTSLSADHALTVALGYGIHAPQGGEAARGRLLFRPEGEAQGSDITLPGGRSAGLYAGQRWLAFGRSEAAAPATHPDLPAGAMFLLAPPGEVGGERAPLQDIPALLALPQESGKGAAAAQQTIEIDIAAAPPPGVDAAYDIMSITGQEGRRRLGRVEIIHDARASRLLREAPPAGPCLRLVGVAVPQRIDGRRISRFWLERDARGRLRQSAMQPAAQACVVQGGRLRLYDRRAMRYASAPSDAFTVETIRAGAEKRQVLTLAEGDWGFIALPPASRSACFTEGMAGPDIWPLDWIGEALILDCAGQGPTPASAIWPARGAALLGPDGGIADQGEAWLLEGGKASSLSGGALPPGARLILGPLVVEVAHAARGAAP